MDVYQQSRAHQMLVDPQASLILTLLVPYLRFNCVYCLCPTDPGFLLCMPSDGTSFMGPSGGELCVRTHADILSILSSWGPPCRLPPNENGEWWEIGDESRGGIPYYYHTKTGETVWDKPDGFVIPLTILQVRSLV